MNEDIHAKTKVKCTKTESSAIIPLPLSQTLINFRRGQLARGFILTTVFLKAEI